MTLLAVDIETEGLDCQKFILGSVVDENFKNKVFYKKKELWNYILDRGEKEKKRKKVLNVYSHGNPFDFYGFADLQDKNLKYYSDTPFIAAYCSKEEDIEYIKFLDTHSIYRMNLKRLGEIIGLEKLDKPEGIETGKSNLEELKTYCIRDSEIVMKAVLHMRNKLENEKVRLKRLYTINQIAIQYLLKQLKTIKPNDFLFFNEDKNMLWKTNNKKRIHSAYRGGRNECFKTGLIQNVTAIDCNSAYGIASTMIRFPDLRTEKLIEFPLNIYNKEELLNEIGISKAIILNKDNDIGLLPIRTPTFSFYPKPNKIIIGTWTHDEIKTAIKEGYELINIEWSVIWKEAKINPFKEIIPNIYNKRFNGSTNFDKEFYKAMMNNAFGKLGQTRINQEFVIDDVNKTKEYIKKGWDIYRGVGNNYMYRKEMPFTNWKSYYAPILPTLINARARIYMYNQFKKIGKDDLIYTDTDSIVFTGNHTDKFKIGLNLGDFKIEEQDTDCLIWGRKTYRIGDNLKVSGVHKDQLKKEDFDKGYFEHEQMITLKTTNDLELVGRFKTEKRDLGQQLRDYHECLNLIQENRLLIDDDITDFSYFYTDIKETLTQF